MTEEDVSGQIDDAKAAHQERAADPGATEGEANEPEGMGFAAPDTGAGEAAESEVPVGADSLSDEQVQAAEERAGGGEGGDDDALDVSAIVAEDDTGETA